jgi:hypothetical protein
LNESETVFTVISGAGGDALWDVGVGLTVEDDVRPHASFNTFRSKSLVDLPATLVAASEPHWTFKGREFRSGF